MNEWGALFWLVSVIAVFSIPFVLFAFLMRLVGRIATRTLVSILVADSILWGLAVFYWWVCRDRVILLHAGIPAPNYCSVTQPAGWGRALGAVPLCVRHDVTSGSHVR